MKAEKNNVVSLSYELRLKGKENEIIDKAEESQPLNFIFGIGMMLPKFEENLLNLKEGDTFEFVLSPEEGYGIRNEDHISEIPKNVFEQDGKIEEGLLTVGNIIPLQDQEGRHYNAQVISITDENVKLDFNHPLADEHLFFTGKILGIRKATKQEIEHGHVHAHGHDH